MGDANRIQPVCFSRGEPCEHCYPRRPFRPCAGRRGLVVRTQPSAYPIAMIRDHRHYFSLLHRWTNRLNVDVCSADCCRLSFLFQHRQLPPMAAPASECPTAAPTNAPLLSPTSTYGTSSPLPVLRLIRGGPEHRAIAFCAAAAMVKVTHSVSESPELG
jgi:hypothetical protein